MQRALHLLRQIAAAAGRARTRPARGRAGDRDARIAGGGQLADQGHHRFRGRSRQPAGRLRPRGRPQRHRQLAAQLGLHRRQPGGDAGAARRRHPRAGSQDQERRRGHGHRDPAAVRPSGLASGRLGERARRRQVARGRHAAGHAAVRRRWRDLCGQPGSARDRRLRRPGRCRERDQGGADLGPDRRRRHRRARGRFRARPAQARPPRPAQSRLHDRRADRARDQRPFPLVGRAGDRPGDREPQRSRRPTRAGPPRC